MFMFTHVNIINIFFHIFFAYIIYLFLVIIILILNHIILSCSLFENYTQTFPLVIVPMIICVLNDLNRLY